MLGQTLRQRYKILRQLGEGGFGKTYLAEDLDLPVTPKPKRVVKQLHPQMMNADMVRRFQQEGEILYKLGQQQPQIPDVYAYFEENGELYLIQEFIEGENLETELSTGRRWTEAETLAFLREILEVLAFVHENQVIHRDIKPANIMRRDRDGKFVLIDFGIVKEIAKGAAETESGQTLAIGTPGYMPSEQTVGQPRFSSDIYALGMTAIQALTGVTPDLLTSDERGEPVWCNLAPVSDRTAAILSKMVAYHFRDRYANANEVLQALNGNSPSPATAAATVAVGAGAPLPAARPNAAISTSRSSPPWLLFAGFAIAGGAVLALLLGIFPSPFRRATQSPKPREVRSTPPSPAANPQPQASTTPKNTPVAPVSPSTASPPVNAAPSPPNAPVTPSPTPTPVAPAPQTTANAVPAFPIDAPRSAVEAALGQPARDLRGAYGNTRAVVYDSVRQGVDLGYLFDRDSGRIQQTEASFRESVDLATARQTLDGLLNGETPTAVRQGLEGVYQRQLDNYRFTVGAVKGQIVRQSCGDIYLSIWDSQLHDFVKYSQIKNC